MHKCFGLVCTPQSESLEQTILVLSDYVIDCTRKKLAEFRSVVVETICYYNKTSFLSCVRRVVIVATFDIAKKVCNI